MQMADMDARTTREAAGTDAGEPAYLQLEGVTKRYAGHQAAVDALHLACRAASCWACWARPAVARHDPAHDRGPVVRDVRSYPGGRRRYFASRRTSATSAWCSRTTPVPACRWRRTSPSAWKCAAWASRTSRRAWTRRWRWCACRIRPAQTQGNVRRAAAAGGAGRALVIRPRILLLTSPVQPDAKLRDEMRLEIRDIQQRLGITTVFVTHDQVEALTMCDVVGVMAAAGWRSWARPGYLRAARHAVRRRFRRPHQLDGQIERRRGAPGRGCIAVTHGLRRGRPRCDPAAPCHVTSDRDRSLVSVATNSAMEACDA